MRRAFALWALVTATSGGSAAVAQTVVDAPQRERVLVLAPRTLPQAAGVVDELEGQRFAAEVLWSDRELAHDEVLELLRARAAVAAITLRRTAVGVECTVFDRATDKRVRRVIPLPTDARRARDVLAVQAVELLRASLLEVATTNAPIGEVRAGPAARALAFARIAPVTTERASVGAIASVGIGARWFSGGFGFAPVVSLEAGVHGARGWGAQLSLSAALTAFEFARDEGTISARPLSILAVGFAVVRPHPLAELQFGGGIGASVLLLRGRASPMYVVRDRDATAVTVQAFAGGGWRPNDRLCIGVDVRVATNLPPVAVRSLDIEIARWGELDVTTQLRASLRW